MYKYRAEPTQIPIELVCDIFQPEGGRQLVEYQCKSIMSRISYAISEKRRDLKEKLRFP